jgi:hypothetical protein
VRDNSLLNQAIGSLFNQNEDYVKGPVFFGGKFELYASTLDRVFGHKSQIQSMQVNAVVFPNFRMDALHQKIKFIGPAGIQRFVNSIKTDRPVPDWLPFPEILGLEQIEQQSICRVEASEVSAFELEFGSSTSLNWNEIDAAIDSL